MNTSLGEELRALSECRELSFRQSAMTVFGTVPPLRDVQEAFSTSLARAVGIEPNTHTPASPAKELQ